MAPSTDQEISQLRSAFWSERDPDGRAFASLADAYRRSGDLDQALALLEEGLDRHPSFASARVVAAWVHRDRGDTAAAESAFREVLELDGENGEALRGLGELAAATGRESEAIGWLTRLSELEPGNDELARRIQEIEWARSALGSEGVAPADRETLLDVDAFEDIEELPDFDATADVDASGAPEASPDDGLDLDDLSLDALGSADAAAAGDGSETADALDFGGGLEDADALEAGAAFEAPDAVPAGGDDVDAADPASPEPWGLDELEAFEDDDDGADTDVEGKGVYTRTMAELYVRQGLHERALDVYEHLLQRRPDDAELRDRVDDLRGRAAAASAPEATPSDDDRQREDEVEALARDWAEGSGEAGDLSTPFAWEASEGDDDEEAPAGPPVGEYFRGLLDWESSRERRPPAADEPVVDVADLAPSPAADEPVVDVADLAPSPAADEPVVDVADLAPSPATDEPVVDVADLAPSPAADEPVVDIGDLAPGTAAPDAGKASDEEEGGRGERGDTFSRWLDRLQ